MPIDLTPYLEREYEVDCDGQILKLKPVKAWVLAPKGRKGVIIGLFKCPNGKTVRKALGKTEQPVE
ncbi:MAG: chorismate-binding protein [Crenarchaeota archaeon]|nr:chorismate-binding protein [Thermoproteota archaeon]NPA71003.1 chorismate-binding protein [Thermoproteota archaeon]NPB00295.1 chorismate-binding protein [Thermoproteota archaeon]